jgi:dihydropteroate synthase
MGVLNVTPDSFSDGGDWYDPARALDHALAMVEAGADLVDVGGESTRPGAAAVSPDEELRRVIPVIEALSAACPVPVSVDTSAPEVMRAWSTTCAPCSAPARWRRSPRRAWRPA